MNEYLRMLSEKRLTLIMSLPYNDPALCRAAFEAGASGLCAAAPAADRGAGRHSWKESGERRTDGCFRKMRFG